MSRNDSFSQAAKKNSNQSQLRITPLKYNQDDQRKQSASTQYGASFPQTGDTQKKKFVVSALLNKAQRKVKDSLTGVIQKVSS